MIRTTWELWGSILNDPARKSLSTGSEDPEINEEYRRMYVALVKAISSYDKGDRANNIKKLQIQQKDKASRRGLYGDLRETNAKTKREYIKYLSRARSGLLKQQETISKAAAENVEPIVAPIRRAARGGNARLGWGSLFDKDSAFDNTSKIDRLGDAEKAATWDRLLGLDEIGVRVLSDGKLEFQDTIAGYPKLQANITDFYQQARRAKNSLDRDRAQIKNSLDSIDADIAGLSKGDQNQRLAPQDQAKVDATMNEFAQSEASLDRLAGYDASTVETELTNYNDESRSMKTMRDRLDQMDARLGKVGAGKAKRIAQTTQLVASPAFQAYALDRNLDIGSLTLREDGTGGLRVGPDFNKAVAQFYYEAKKSPNSYGALRKRRTGETVLITETLPEDRDLAPYRATSGENKGKLIYSASFDGKPKLLKASDLKSMQDSGKFASVYRVNEGVMTGALVTTEGRLWVNMGGKFVDKTLTAHEDYRQITPGMSKIYLTNENQEPLRYFTEEDIGKKGLTPVYDDGIVSLEGLGDYQIKYSDEPLTREAMTVGFKLRQHASDSISDQINGEHFFEIETGPTNTVERFDASTSRMDVLTGPVERLSMSDIGAMARKKVDPEITAQVLAGVEAGVDLAREPREGPLKKLFNQFAIRDLGRAAPDDIKQYKADEAKKKALINISRIDAQLASLNPGIEAQLANLNPVIEAQLAAFDANEGREIKEIIDRGLDLSQYSSETDVQRLQDLQSQRDDISRQRDDISRPRTELENRKRTIYGSLDMVGEDIDVEAFGRSAEPLGTGQEEAIEKGEKKRENIFERAAKAAKLTIGDRRRAKMGKGTRWAKKEEEDETVLAGADTQKPGAQTDFDLWRARADAPDKLPWGEGEDPVEKKKGFRAVPGAVTSFLSRAVKGKDVPVEEPTVQMEDLSTGTSADPKELLTDESLDEETRKRIKQAEKELDLEGEQPGAQP